MIVLKFPDNRGILSGVWTKYKDYLSPEPQAEPQPVGLSVSLSPPQDEPQDVETAAALLFLVQAYKFESAIFITSCMYLRNLSFLKYIVS